MDCWFYARASCTGPQPPETLRTLTTLPAVKGRSFPQDNEE